MVEYLKKHAADKVWMIARLGVVVIMMAPLTDWAATDGLVDPTQSPMDIATSGADGSNPAEPVLQSVLLSSGRKLAVISGQSFKVGDKVGEATLVKVSDHEAVLRNSDNSLQTLSMHPGVVKKVIHQPQEATSAVRKTKRPVTRAGQIK